MRALIVVPTYNEALTIEELLTRVRAAVPEADVLVVDDGSPDGTAALVERLGADLGQIRVLRRTAKSGLGAAYRAGFSQGLAAGYDVLVEMDADLSHDPAALPSLFATVEAGASLAVGSRYVRGGAIPNWTWHRRALSRGGNRYVRLVLGLPVRDATSGFRAYTAEALRTIDVVHLRSQGYTFQIETAYAVHRAGHRVVETPIAFVDRELGTSKMSGSIVVEALARVTWWAVRDRLVRSRAVAPSS